MVFVICVKTAANLAITLIDSITDSVCLEYNVVVIFFPAPSTGGQARYASFYLKMPSHCERKRSLNLALNTNYPGHFLFLYNLRCE